MRYKNRLPVTKSVYPYRKDPFKNYNKTYFLPYFYVPAKERVLLLEKAIKLMVLLGNKRGKIS